MNLKIPAVILVALGGITAVGNWVTRPEYKTVATGTYYVDPTGNNANACTASGTAACSTLTGALAKIAPRVLHAQTINVAAGAYTDTPGLLGHEVLAGITITGPALTNVTPTTGTATGTLTAVANTAPAVFTDGTQSWTVNNFVGRLLTISGVSRVIASNTATTITTASIFSSTPSIGAAYSIQRQAATVTATSTGGVFTLRLNGNAGGAGSVVTVAASGIDFVNSGSGSGCEFALSNQAVTLSNSRCRGSSAGLSWRGGGQITPASASLHGTSTGLLFSPGATGSVATNGTLNASNAFFNADTGDGLSVAGAGIITLSGASGWTAQSSTSGSAMAISGQVIRTISGTGVAALRCLGASSTGLMHQTLSVFPNTAVAYFATDYLYVDGCATAVDFSQGAGNATGVVLTSLTCNNTTTCVKVAGGSRFRVPATFTLNGVTNDITIDGTNYTKANLTGASPTRLPTSPTIFGSSVWQ